MRPNTNEIMLATSMRPIENSTKKHHKSVADILAIHMKNTMWESHIWKISSSKTPKYAIIDVTDVRPMIVNLSE
jgi:hypothetical protein